MDLLRECAAAFQQLLVYEYHFVVGRKGQIREFYVTFQTSDFHHIAGLHKLKDIAQIQQGMREKVFEKIITGEISQTLIEKSEYYEQMQGQPRYTLLKKEKKNVQTGETIVQYNSLK